MLFEDRDAKDTGEDIAIVGMACLFPKADGLCRYWENIVGKVDCITDAPPDWQPELFYDPAGAQVDRTYSLKGAFLGDLCRFNPSRYGVMPHSVEGAEPDHFIALKCAADALVDAGAPEVPFNRQKTGVIIGRGLFVNRGWVSVFQRTFGVDQVISVLRQLEPDRSAQDFEHIKTELKRHLPAGNVEAIPGLVHSALVGRIANRLNLNGPAFTVDAACSSALLAAEIGMRELRAGSCDAVLVGGAQVSNPGPVHVIFSHLQALSRSGEIAPFSAEAQGTLLGQGCGILMLKRRSDAERDGNRIYALLKSIGISSDGRGAGLLAPLSEGQQLAIRRAYATTDVEPGSVGLIEAHGTGIPLGDRTEFESLNSCFKSAADRDRQTIALGSVKSMIGHLIPASGAASMIKTALAIYHRTIPPTLHADTPNPALPLTESRFYLANQSKPWLHSVRSTPRRAAINAFGFGGINAHAIMEECQGQHDMSLRRHERRWPAELVVVSAPDRDALLSKLQSLSAWVSDLENEEIELVDVAAACSREVGECRISIVASGFADLRNKLNHAAELLSNSDKRRIQDRGGIFWYADPLASLGRIAFVFPGEGAQYVDMMEDLCRHFPEVRREFDLTATALEECGVEIPLGQVLYPQPQGREAAEQRLLELEAAVATVTAAGRAFMGLLGELKITPDAIVGHSSGEFGALLAAGVYRPKSQEEIIETIIAGAHSAKELQQSNLVPRASLLSVGGAASRVVNEIVAGSHGKLVIAMDNCPHQQVIVGSDADIDVAMEALKGKGGLCQKLPWDRAYHTEWFAPACKIIQDYYDRFELLAPVTELWSCATAAKYPTCPKDVAEIAVRQWRSPVRFRETVEAMYADGIRLFVELGPRGNLAAFISDALAGTEHAAVPLDLHTKNGLVQLCRAVGQLVAHGVKADLTRLYEFRSMHQVDLNTQPPRPEKKDPILPLEFPTFRLTDRAVQLWQKNAPSAVNGASIAKIESFDESAGGLEESAPMRLTPIVETAAQTTQNRDLGIRHGSQNGQTLRQPDVMGTRGGLPYRSAGSSPWVEAHADFQHTMQVFLKTQQAMLSAVGDAAVEDAAVEDAAVEDTESLPYYPPASRAGLGHAPVDQHALTRQDRESATARRKPWRFLERIVEYKPGESLVAECELDPMRHSFLYDHTFFGRDLSHRDPALKAISIMPLAMTLEMLAEAAAELNPGLRVVALSDIVTAKWLAFESKTRRVRMIAVKQDDVRNHVRLVEADAEANELIAEAIVELSDRVPVLGPTQIKEVLGSAPPWAPQDLYRSVLYHGPAFQGIDIVDRRGPHGIQARVKKPDPDLMFRDASCRDLILPVALVDTASQLPGLLNVSESPDDAEIGLAFPNTTARLEFLPESQIPDHLVASASYEQDDAYLRSDVEIRSIDGQVLLRYMGRVEERVSFPLGLYQYQADPTAMTCCREITGLFRGISGIEGCRVTETHRAGDKILINHLWSEVAARMTLSRREREIWGQLRLPPVGRASWLLGRMAAKDAVRLLCEVPRCMADVIIETEHGTGKPIVDLSDREAPIISIAHKVFYAVAVASDKHSAVGIDVEPIGELDSGVVEDSFHPSELALPAITAQTMAAVWTAKESIGKALGTGLIGGPRSVRIISAEPAPQGGVDFLVQLDRRMAEQFPQYAIKNDESAVLKSHCRVQRQHFVALCLIP